MELLEHLLPSQSDLALSSFDVDSVNHQLVLRVRSTQKLAQCPLCNTSSLITGGIGLGSWFRAALAHNQKPTAEVKWVNTADGQTAKQINDWNAETIRLCQSQIKPMKGKCVIWV